MNAPRWNSPKTCTRCNGKGFVTFTTYAGGFCMGCGGDGIVKGAESIVKSVSLEGEFGGADATITIRHRAADHRAAIWTVSTTSRFGFDGGVVEGSTTHDNLEAARTAANAAYRTAKAEVAAVYAARLADREARRAARQAA